MNIPEYVDERAKKFFQQYYVGTKRVGADSHGYEVSYCSTHEELKLTRTAYIGCQYHCAYCGRKAMPIQANIRRFEDYRTTGHCCVCTGAMDQLEMDSKLAEAEKVHNLVVRELKQAGPKVNIEALMEAKIAYLRLQAKHTYLSIDELENK